MKSKQTLEHLQATECAPPFGSSTPTSHVFFFSYLSLSRFFTTYKPRFCSHLSLCLGSSTPISHVFAVDFHCLGFSTPTSHDFDAISSTPTNNFHAPTGATSRRGGRRRRRGNYIFLPMFLYRANQILLH